MTKIVIFGSTGFTGQRVVQEALEAGHSVRVLVRDPARLPDDTRDKVEVIVGDVLNLEDVTRAVEGQDGVIVVLGTRNDLSPTTIMSEGMKNISEAMKKCNVRRVSVCISAFLFFEPEKVPPRFLPLTEDHRRMSQVLKSNGNELDWIAVYPPHIEDMPGTNGGYTVSHEPEPSSTFRGRRISVHDLAHFLVHSLDKPEHYQKVCGVAS